MTRTEGNIMRIEGVTVYFEGKAIRFVVETDCSHGRMI